MCAPSGRELATAAGPNNAPGLFGLEHRSIWLLRTDGTPVRQLTRPPATDLSDEAPRFSRDGHWILFVRTRVVNTDFGGTSRDALELVRTDGAGSPVQLLEFTSDDFSFYDHFKWPSEIAWSASGRRG
jgi:Tol biopolymer transport system component